MNQHQPEWTLTEAQQQPKRRRWITPAVAVAALAAGVAIGATSQPEVAAEPEVITETVTETVIEKVAPAACVDAITEAEAIFLDVADLMSDTMPLAVESAYYRDAAGMEQATAQIDSLSGSIILSTFPSLAAECREAS